MTFQFRDDVDRMDRKALIAYVGDLESHLTGFVAADDTVARLKAHFGVRPSGARLLAELASGRPVSRERLFASIVANPDSGEKLLDVQLCHTRKKIEGSGVVISTIWGAGFQITEGAELVRAVARGAA